MKKILFVITLCLFSGIALYAQDSLKQYVGKYKFPDGSVVPEIEVVLDNGALDFNSIMGSTPVEKTKNDEFSIPQYNGTATFIRNEAKKIVGLKIEAQGTVLEGTIVENKPVEKSSGGDDILTNPKYIIFPQVPYHGGE
ncbi:MAG: hypothetical protein KA319_10090 [Ferruginibacter sp.]|nr:hypothetical protein [Ferruginibacter sp.]